jgi:hypothetical protein
MHFDSDQRNFTGTDTLFLIAGKNNLSDRRRWLLQQQEIVHEFAKFGGI